jgi:hypothetical protein
MHCSNSSARARFFPNKYSSRFVIKILFREQDAQVSQIVSRGPGLDCVAELAEEGIRIAAPEIVGRFKPQGLRVSQSFAGSDGTGRGT